MGLGFPTPGSKTQHELAILGKQWNVDLDLLENMTSALSHSLIADRY